LTKCHTKCRWKRGRVDDENRTRYTWNSSGRDRARSIRDFFTRAQRRRVVCYYCYHYLLSDRSYCCTSYNYRRVPWLAPDSLVAAKRFSCFSIRRHLFRFHKNNTREGVHKNRCRPDSIRVDKKIRLRRSTSAARSIVFCLIFFCFTVDDSRVST